MTTVQVPRNPDFPVMEVGSASQRAVFLAELVTAGDVQLSRAEVLALAQVYATIAVEGQVRRLVAVQA